MARWLFSTPEFKAWLQGTGQTLWCTGMRMSWFHFSILGEFKFAILILSLGKLLHEYLKVYPLT